MTRAALNGSAPLFQTGSVFGPTSLPAEREPERNSRGGAQSATIYPLPGAWCLRPPVVVERRRRDVLRPMRFFTVTRSTFLSINRVANVLSEIMRRHGIGTPAAPNTFQNSREGRGVQRAIHPQPPPDRVVPEKKPGTFALTSSHSATVLRIAGREEGLSFLFSPIRRIVPPSTSTLSN